MRKVFLVAIPVLLVAVSSCSRKQTPAEQLLWASYKKCRALTSLAYSSSYFLTPMGADSSKAISIRGECEFKKHGFDDYYFHTTSIDQTYGWRHESFAIPDTLFDIESDSLRITYYPKSEYPFQHFLYSEGFQAASDVFSNMYAHYLHNRIDAIFLDNALDLYGGDDVHDTLFTTDSSWIAVLRTGPFTGIYTISRKDTLPRSYTNRIAIKGKGVQIAHWNCVIHGTTVRPIPIRRYIDSLKQTYKYVTYKYVPPEKLPLGSEVSWAGRYFEGDTVTSGNFRGRYVLYAFTYRDCPHCIDAIPMLNKAMKTFPALRVTGLDPYDAGKPDMLREHIREKDIRFPIIFIAYKRAESLKINAYPTFYLVDPGGKLVWRKTGYLPAQENSMIERLREILQKKNS